MTTLRCQCAEGYLTTPKVAGQRISCEVGTCVRHRAGRAADQARSRRGPVCPGEPLEHLLIYANINLLAAGGGAITCLDGPLAAGRVAQLPVGRVPAAS